MQLLSGITKKQYIPHIPPTEFLKQPFSVIERFGMQSGEFIIFSHGFPAPVSILEFYMEKRPSETSITLQPQRSIKELEELYTFDNPKEIRNFLINNNYLIEILFEAPGHIFRIFGQVPIHLELHQDPEEYWDELFIIIKSACSTDEAIRLENRLAQEWFLDKMKDSKAKLNIIEEPL